MKRKIWINALFLIIAMGMLASCSQAEGSTKAFTRPNVMLDDTVYWFSVSFEDLTLPDSFALVGTTTISDTGIAEENFSASGVAAGAEIYQSDDYPGWIYVRWDKYLNQFAVWELMCSLLKYNDTLYISILDFTGFREAENYDLPEAPRFTKSYEYKGDLVFGEHCTVPSREFETNSAVHKNGKLFYNEADPSTVYVDVSGTYHAFYDVSLIPLDYSIYENTRMT